MVKEVGGNMAIRMRVNKHEGALCCECGSYQGEVLNMFDLQVGNKKLTICDQCNEELFQKCLKADGVKNARVKTQRDLSVIRKRKNKWDVLKE